MSVQNPETHKEDILERLRTAGAEGLNKRKLGIRSKAKIQALKALEKEKKIANLESAGNRYLYVLKAFDDPLKIACERVENQIISYGTTLFHQTRIVKDCQKGCPGRARKELKNALLCLVRENKVLRFRHRNYFVFLHISSLPALPDFFADAREKETSPKPNREQVLEAYREVRRRVGFSNVEIYELQQALGIPMEALKAFLLEEARAGRAVLALSDWSLASEGVRSGAIWLDGRPHLLVRFET